MSLSLDKIERGLQKIKKGALPKTPETIEDINGTFKQESVIESYGTTLQTVDSDGNELTQKYSFFEGAVENKRQQFSFCVFSSKATVKLINEYIPIGERHILMDGTFTVVPLGKFNQLFILYIRKQSKVFVCTNICVSYVFCCSYC